jgi:hypothetical protein
VLAPLLSYRYEAPVGTCLRRFRPIDETILKQFLEKAKQPPLRPIREFPLPQRPILLDPIRVPRAALALPREGVQTALAPQSNTRLMLRIDNVTPPPDDSAFVRVFVGLPEGSEPSPDSPYYAGAFAFFTDPEHPMAFTTMVDVTPVLQRVAQKAGAGENGQTVTFVAVPGRPQMRAPAPIRIGAITPVAIPRQQIPKPLQ